MHRRQFLSSAGALALAPYVSACATTKSLAAAPAASPAKDAQLRTMLDRFFYERLATNPESATGGGFDKGNLARLRFMLDDYSQAGADGDLARAMAELASLRSLGRDRLSEAAAVDYDVVEYGLERAISGAERFNYGSSGGRYAPYVISQLTGPYRGIPDFLDSQHPIEVAEDADAYIARLAAFPRVLDQSTERQRQDAARGVFAPDYLLDTTLRQMRTLRDQPAAKTQLVQSLARRTAAKGIAGDWERKAEKIVAESVYPALDRQIALVTELRARAVHDAGVWRLPDGDAYYQGAIEASTTTKLTADEVHRIGLEQVAELEAQLDPILRKEGLTRGTAGERLAELNKRSDQLFPNTDEGREALIAELNRQIAEIEAQLPRAFGNLPKAKVVARRVPELIQAGSPGAYYDSAPLDNSRPATYFINLRDTFDRPKFGLRTLTHHEATPGHHLQVSLAQESEEIPLIRRFGGYSAYSEGWALYAEQLADELGMFQGRPLERAGMLQSFLFRATRLVVDSGMHAKRWSREQATDYFLRTTGIARGRGQNEIDRYTAWPGQALSYKIGHTVWLRLRDEARAKLGSRFDLKEFHQILLLGSMPLTILERQVAARTARAGERRG
jgi:uncharacterized protein (DUF885 family)